MGLLEKIKKTGMFLVDNGLYNTGKSWYSGENLLNIGLLASVPLTGGMSLPALGGKALLQTGVKAALKTGATVATKEVGEKAAIKAAEAAASRVSRLEGLKSASPAVKAQARKEAEALAAKATEGAAASATVATEKSLLANTAATLGGAGLGLGKGTLQTAWNHPKKTLAGLTALDGYSNDWGVTKYLGGKLVGSSSSDDKEPGSMPSVLDVITDPAGSLKSAFSSVAQLDPSGGPLALGVGIALTRMAFSAVGLNMPFDGVAKLVMYAALGYGLYKMFADGVDVKRDPSVDAHNSDMLNTFRPAAPALQ